MKFDFVTLGEVYEVSSGLSKRKDSFGHGHPFLSFKTVFNNAFLPDVLTELADATEKERRACSIMRGDVFLTRTSENTDELGMSSVALKDYPDATFNGFTKRLRTKNNGAINPIFAGYWFRSKHFRELIKSMSVMTTRASLNSEMIKRLSMPLPDIKTQNSIANELFSFDKAIVNNKKINNHLEQMAQAIFKSWFVDFEPFDGVMPENWREGTISDFGDVVGGSTPSKAKPEYYTEHGIAWITPKDLSVNKSKFISRGADDITELGLKNSSARLMPKGTVLFSSRAPIGYIAIASGEVCTNQGFKSIVPKGSVGPAFIYHFLIENLQTIENMASGSTFKEVSGTTMKGIPAIIPDDGTLCRFQEECTPIFVKQELLEAENAHLADIRDSLLPRLMSGELSVADLDAAK
ncbi:MAG: restriction endonuclease subunit S [Clostridiales bacterium]|nr:restriction endonuclease subunit S [Clostridiales bacterium]